MTDLEIAEKVFFDKYWSVLQSDYDYYLLSPNSSNNHVDMTMLQSNQDFSLHTQYDICLFNDTATVDIVKDYNQKITISHCEKRYVIDVNHDYVIQGESNNYTTTSVSFSFSNNLDNFNTYRYYKTNYFDYVSSSSDVSLNVDTLVPYFLVLGSLLCLIFFSLVFRRR